MIFNLRYLNIKYYNCFSVLPTTYLVSDDSDDDVGAFP